MKNYYTDRQKISILAFKKFMQEVDAINFDIFRNLSLILNKQKHDELIAKIQFRKKKIDLSLKEFKSIDCEIVKKQNLLIVDLEKIYTDFCKALYKYLFLVYKDLDNKKIPSQITKLENLYKKFTILSINILSEISAYEAKYDDLTRLFNKSYFLKYTDDTLEDGNNFCVIMADIDFFKKVNDRYGHLAGDSILIQIADILRSKIGNNVVARYGGEEFVFLVKGDEKFAKKLILEIQNEIKNHTFTYDNKNIYITLSFGLAKGNNKNIFKNIIKNADSALYSSKHDGRNKVTVF